MNTGTVANATNGYVTFSLTPELANLPTNSYKSYVKLYQPVNGTNTYVGMAYKTDLRVEWSPSATNFTYQGPYTNATAPITSIVAGTNITISPSTGLGAVTINAAASSTHTNQNMGVMTNWAAATVDGKVNYNSNIITNYGTPANDDEVIDKGYADARYVELAGDSMTGDLNMGGNDVTNAGNVTATGNVSVASGKVVNFEGESGDTSLGFDGTEFEFIVDGVQSLNVRGSLIRMRDDVAYYFGTGLDYYMTYDSAPTPRFQFGGGSGDIFTINDGTSDIAFSGALTNLTTLHGNAGSTITSSVPLTVEGDVIVTSAGSIYLDTGARLTLDGVGGTEYFFGNANKIGAKVGGSTVAWFGSTYLNLLDSKELQMGTDDDYALIYDSTTDALEVTGTGNTNIIAFHDTAITSSVPLKVQALNIETTGNYDILTSTNTGLILDASGSQSLKAGSGGFQYNYNNGSSGSILFYGGGASSVYTVDTSGNVDASGDITSVQAATNNASLTWYSASNRWAIVQVINSTTNVTFVSPTP